MKKLLTLIAFICFWANANAQYVNIPDSNFRNFLKQQYPSCFNSVGQMDTTCIAYSNIISLDCSYRNIQTLDGIQYFKKLINLNCSRNLLISLPIFSDSLAYLGCDHNLLASLPKLPSLLNQLDCSYNRLTNLLVLPNSLTELDCSNNMISVLPILPNNIKVLYCLSNHLTGLPYLPNSITHLDCSNNTLSTLSTLPDSLKRLACNNINISNLPNLPLNLEWLECNNNKLTMLNTLPITLFYLSCKNNNLNSLPTLPQKLNSLVCDGNNINCFPRLPDSLYGISFTNNPVSCIPNYFYGYSFQFYPPICNPTNNPNHCLSFPIIQSHAYTDNNNNNKLDNNEYSKRNLKFTLSNNNYTYTNTQGTAYINADSLGTYTITAQAPPLYNAVPASYTHTFNSYDTLVLDTFALQPITIKDSLSISITSLNFAARPGFKYVYKCEFENVGTTITNPNISFKYDSSVLVVDSTNNAAITNTGNSLSLTVNNFVPGQTNSFYVYCTVKPTATPGNSLQATASINANNTNATDTANTTIRGSYDPNDKQATPKLTVTEVADNNHWINYTVRFQNTGNDTAFTVVVADTLDANKLQTNTLQLTGLSHNCKVSQSDNIVYFEFLNINLPDSNKNKTTSNGYVSFRVKPLTTLVDGNIVPNKASIYFDYNSPINTNTANTIIGNTLPLTLTAFGAIPKEEQNKIFVYWNTANEINTSYFIIEQSEDGRTFAPAAEVAAIGKGNNSYYYNIAKNNVQYIRLKMVDKNGIYTYSNIIKLPINQSTNQQSIIVASPAKNELRINVIATNLHNTKASLINGQGKVVKTFMLKQGYQTIDIAALQSGLYYLQTNEVIKKVVIE